jgi:tetratricopeptide (TPR) repeat protein
MSRRPSLLLAFTLGLMVAFGAFSQEATESPEASAVAASPAPAQAAALAPDALKTLQRGRDLEAAGRMADANVKYQEAINICDQELLAKPSRMEAYVVKTWSLLRLKRFAETISAGLAALRVGNDARILESLGEAYFYQKDMETSLKYFQRYVDVMPENGDKVATAYYFMGEAYAGLRKYDHADIAFTTALYMSPKSYRWWYRYGVLRESRAEKDLALKAYEKALELSPTYADAIGARDKLKTQVPQ